MNTHDEQIKVRLINLLENNHMGRARAIKRRDLLEELELPESYDRRLRKIIESLRHKDLPVCFATAEPAGYYIPENLAETREVERILLGYIKNLCMIKRALKVRGTQYIHQETQRRFIW